MSGEYNLETLIRSMEPVLHPQTYVFVTVPKDFDTKPVKALMQFEEQEGTTLILEQKVAVQAGLPFEFPCRKITLNVHSALDAVGFLARVTTKLAGLGMGVNPVSGFYHDHLFIPEDRAEDAMTALLEMTKS
ncbi:MAG: ACT domain-containing protein [Kordiimonadaceae bacterium]|nr:ACT domain-containing protein [Kordiimonadaceae bacterium]MBO6570236.1 ACT domain-containing protein [Kordiimonadaceae bacterium]MBO6965666.1 ACT domain-containing protein [Kordiimonadaceae bacterium]